MLTETESDSLYNNGVRLESTKYLRAERKAYLNIGWALGLKNYKTIKFPQRSWPPAKKQLLLQLTPRESKFSKPILWEFLGTQFLNNWTQNLKFLHITLPGPRVLDKRFFCLHCLWKWQNDQLIGVLLMLSCHSKIEVSSTILYLVFDQSTPCKLVMIFLKKFSNFS